MVQGVTPDSPVNIENEQVVIGAVIVTPSLLSSVSEVLKAEHFYDPVHEAIWGVVEDMVLSGQTVDAFSVAKHLRNNPALEQIGGAQYIAGLAASSVAIAWSGDLMAAARSIVDDYNRRHIMQIAHEAMWEAAKEATSTTEIIGKTIDKLGQVGDGETQDGWRSIGRVGEEVDIQLELANSGTGIAIPTGLPDLDYKIGGGFYPGEVCYVAARPSHGKTTLATSTALNMVLNEERPSFVGFFSMEMDRIRLGQRIMSDYLQRHGKEIPYTSMRKGLNDKDRKLVQRARERLQGYPLYIDDRSRLTGDELLQAAERLMRKAADGGVETGVFFVDWLKFIDPALRSGASMHQAFTERSAQIVRLAKRTGMPVVALHQLVKPKPGEEHKEPQISALRESGSMEEDADTVLLIHRPEREIALAKPQMDAGMDDVAYAEWASKRDAAAGLMKVIVAKNRNGPVGTVYLNCLMEFSAVRHKEYR